MRIAILTRRFFRAGGGAESYAVELARALSSRHEVHVYCQQTDEPLPQVRYHRLWSLGERPRWINQWVFAWTSWRATREGFDVVHSHENTWQGQIQTIHVRPLRHSVLQGRRGWRWWARVLKVALSPRLLTYFYLEAARFARRPARHVVATSQALRVECLQAYPHAEVEVITPGVTLSDQPLSSTDARQRLALPVDGPCLLFVANDYARKGLDALLQALSHLPPQVHLAVVGSRRPQAVYQAQAEQLGLASRVHFLGPLSDVSLAYQAADLLIHPTLEDSYAMVVLEAMAHGVPVVVSASPWCGIAAELRDGHEALLLSDPRDAQAVSVLIQRLLDDADLRRQLSEAGRAFAAQRSWEGAALKYEALYRQASA